MESSFPDQNCFYIHLTTFLLKYTILHSFYHTINFPTPTNLFLIFSLVSLLLYPISNSFFCTLFFYLFYQNHLTLHLVPHTASFAHLWKHPAWMPLYAVSRTINRSALFEFLQVVPSDHQSTRWWLTASAQWSVVNTAIILFQNWFGFTLLDIRLPFCNFSFINYVTVVVVNSSRVRTGSRGHHWLSIGHVTGDLQNFWFLLRKAHPDAIVDWFSYNNDDK
jgi:hypothetical protein